MNGLHILLAAGAILTLTGVGRAQTTRPAMKDFLGICGHTVQFKPDLYAPVCTLVRDYHPVEWDLAKDTAVLPAWPLAKNKVSWEQVYGSWAKRGYRVNACLMFETEPAKAWQNLDADASAYAQAFAKRFGPSAKLPLVESVEIGNEPGSYTDGEYAQVLRAFSRGIRAGDPKLKIGTCNLVVGKSHKYAKSASILENMSDTFDVLTIHTYAQLEGWPTWKRSFPEDPRLAYLKDVRDLAAWRDQHARGKPIWITEFGYDATTKTPDPKTEFAKWVGVTELQQAQYLVRSALVFSAMPVDRAYIYFFNDDDAPHVHGSSGITRKFVPKPAYHALVQMQKLLGEFRFSRAIAEKANEVYAYEFVHAVDKTRKTVVVWSPTGAARQATIALDLGGAQIFAAEPMQVDDRPVPMLTPPSAATLPISESPLYLHLRPKATSPAATKPTPSR